jgi:multicomponent K+:H+ antiporter subunit E
VFYDIVVANLQVVKGLALFTVKVFYDIVVANLQVVKLVLGPKSRLEPAFVEVPVAIEDEFVLSTLACIISLTPGTVSASLSSDHKILLVHGLDVPDREELIAAVKSRYEAPLLEIFECSRT